LPLRAHAINKNQQDRRYSLSGKPFHSFPPWPKRSFMCHLEHRSIPHNGLRACRSSFLENSNSRANVDLMELAVWIASGTRRNGQQRAHDAHSRETGQRFAMFESEHLHFEAERLNCHQ